MPKSSSRSYRRSGRGVFYTASGSSGRSSPAYPAAPTSVTRRAVAEWSEPDPVLLPVDRRLYNPVPAFVRPAQRFSGRPARVVAPSVLNRPVARPAGSGTRSKPLRISPARLLFAQPQNVAVCVQRGVRKEVLHARGVAGKRGLAKPKRGPYSSIRCRR